MRRLWGLVLVGLLGCPGKPAEAPIDAGAELEDAGLPPVVDAGPPKPRVMQPQVEAAFADGGTANLVGAPAIDAPASLIVTLPAPLKDFRLRLMDWQDKLVPSDDALTGARYEIRPTEPLKTGRSYSLQLDAELGPVITDQAGGTWDDWQLGFRIAGEVQTEPKPGKAPKPKKKPGKR